jgi:hypothetical protein
MQDDAPQPESSFPSAFRLQNRKPAGIRRHTSRPLRAPTLMRL